VARVALGLGMLGLAAPVHAVETRTVGRDGTYATIQAAIDDAIAAGGDQDIRVEVGHYPESLVVVPPYSSSLSRLRLLGGWEKGFGSRVSTAASTVIDGGGTARVLNVSGRGAQRIAVDGFTLTRGFEPVAAGVRVSLQDDAHMSLTNNRILDNLGRGDVAQAAGLHASTWGTAQLWMSDNVVQGNRIQTERWAFGAGAWIFAGDSSRIDVRSSLFLGNEARVAADEPTYGDGLGAFVAGSATIVLDRNTFQGNRSLSPRGGTALDLGSEGKLTGVRSLVVSRSQVLDNVGGARAQVGFSVGPSTTVTLTDSVVAGGGGWAIHGSVGEGGTIHATNLTITRNGGMAFVADILGGQAYLSNTILFGNGGDVSGVVETHNLREDPSFVEPSSDFHLRPGSVAIDAGDNAAPGGLGSSDIDGDPRIRGIHADVGADEAAACPGPGPCREPACTVLPVAGESTNVCRCVSEPALHSFRCGALLDDLMLIAHVPFDRDPSIPLPIRWTILPVMPVAGSYSMSAAALLGSQWEPQTWQGPSSPSLKDGTPVTESFVWKIPGTQATPVRTRLKYVPAGAAQAREVTLEVTLPELPK
jgi:hypothetical protein